MAWTISSIVYGASVVASLTSFPIFCIYILMILLAKQWKKICPPLDLRPVLVVYNFTASAVSVYTLCGFVYGITQSESSFQRDEIAVFRPIFKIYWLTKIYELLDTVFMILRHKQRQITFLHVYHHGSMIILSDLCNSIYPYPAVAPYLALNSAVHVLLYLYYGLSALYPNNPPQWKKFLTQFQIFQFLLDMVHASIGYLYYGYCVYSIFYGLSMMILFSNFYYIAYVKVRNPKSTSNGMTNGVKVATKKEQ